MASEITVRASISVENGEVNGARAKGPFTRDMAGDILHHTIQSVGFAAEEALSLGDAGAGGYVFLENLDATNFVSVRQATGAANMLQLKPGDVALFRLSPDATAPYVIADAGAVKLDVFVAKL